MEAKEKLLHIYGQTSEHETVVLMGMTESLKKLADQILKAVAIEEWAVIKGNTGEFMVADGEYFDVMVKVEDSGWQKGGWQGYVPPYSGRRYDITDYNLFYPVGQDEFAEINANRIEQ